MLCDQVHSVLVLFTLKGVVPERFNRLYKMLFFIVLFPYLFVDFEIAPVENGVTTIFNNKFISVYLCWATRYCFLKGTPKTTPQRCNSVQCHGKLP